jgi:hypothetical protein
LSAYVCTIAETREFVGGGRACLLCPGISDVNLFRYCQGIIDLDAEIPDRTFDLGMPKQELDGPEISRPPINQGSFGAAQRVHPEQPRGSSPTLPIHSETRRAYWRVVILRLVPLWPVNKNSPGRLPVTFR